VQLPGEDQFDSRQGKEQISQRHRRGGARKSQKNHIKGEGGGFSRQSEREGEGKCLACRGDGGEEKSIQHYPSSHKKKHHYTLKSSYGGGRRKKKEKKPPPVYEKEKGDWGEKAFQVPSRKGGKRKMESIPFDKKRGLNRRGVPQPPKRGKEWRKLYVFLSQDQHCFER